MSVPDRRILDVMLTTLLFAVVLATLNVGRGVLLVFAFAILLTYFIDPVVRSLKISSSSVAATVVSPILAISVLAEGRRMADGFIRNLKGIFVLLFFLQVSFPLNCSAQQLSADATGSLQLSLKEAVQLALKENPQRIIAQLLVSESDRNSQIARAALLP
jgi:predicted PurR-regulated permease PerM